jgi:hypothetical protein
MWDILLTNEEEVCNSTAKDFLTSKKYNWIVSFDREGTDVVTYEYRSKPWLSALGKHFTIGVGSYSDIRELEHLGACAVNVGNGTHAGHSRGAWLSINEYNMQWGKFLDFYNDNKDKQYKHKASKWKWWQAMDNKDYTFPREFYNG